MSGMLFGSILIAKPLEHEMRVETSLVSGHTTPWRKLEYSSGGSRKFIMTGITLWHRIPQVFTKYKVLTVGKHATRGHSNTGHLGREVKPAQGDTQTSSSQASESTVGVEGQLCTRTSHRTQSTRTCFCGRPESISEA